MTQTRQDKKAQNMKEKKNNNVCTVCKSTEEKEVNCEMCSKHYCIDCVGISEKHYTLLHEFPSAHWYCPQCEKKAIEVVKADFIVEERCKNMEKRMLSFESELQKRVTKDEVKEMMSDYLAKEEEKTCVPETQVKDVVSTMLESHSEAQNDKESRKNNIIIHHVDESKSGESEKRKEDDMEYLSNLTTELGMNETGIDKVVRLGERKEDANKPRAMKVTFDSEKSKKSFMSKLSKLAKAPKKFNRISVAHDMTKTERETNKKLVEEAKKKNQDDPSENWTYRVRGLPGNLKVVKITKKA